MSEKTALKLLKEHQVTKSLRICRVCGLEANTDAEFEYFRKLKTSAYGHDNICKKCFAIKRKEKICKTNELMEEFKKRVSDGVIKCYFCGKEIKKFEGKNNDSLCIHSLDGVHENWVPPNKVPSHWSCHSYYHNMGGKSYYWKGEEASNHTKYMRLHRERMRKMRLEGIHNGF